MTLAPHTNSSTENLKTLATAIRFLSIDATQKANSGHPGMPMGMADIAAVLFTEFLNFDPQQPNWPGRDRFVLSNGHGSMLHYSLLHLFGYNVHLEDIKNFRKFGSNTPGHPEFGHTQGVETTTGPLGQGFATAIGMAIGQEALAAHSTGLFNNKTYISVGDGCLMEGISHEAAELAGALKLKNVITLFDSNAISIDGDVSITSNTDVTTRFKAYGWVVTHADGHNYQSIRKALTWAQTQTKPSLIIFKTTIGYGGPMAGTAKAHGSPLTPGERTHVQQNLNWPYSSFEIPQSVYAFCKTAIKRGQTKHQQWQATFEKLPQQIKSNFKERLTHNTDKAQTALQELKKEVFCNKDYQKPQATRTASGVCVNTIAQHDLGFMSGSADLTSSNNTKPKNYAPINAENFSGNYIHYGVREHGMAAIMNGLSLYGGLRPISGTFLAFVDYLKPSMRLSALMAQPVTYVFTHDSIGVGEDGPTHQPVEQLAMLRATPNLHTWRPADLIETIECWQTILQNKSTPNALVLSRQNLPLVRQYTKENLCARGGYILCEEEGPLEGIFIATGSELHLAQKAQQALTKEGIHTRVVSIPSVEVFLQQPKTYQEKVLPKTCTKRVVIEAATSFGWHKIAPRGEFITLEGFGASAPAEKLFKEFGFYTENVIEVMKAQIMQKAP